MLRLKLFFPDDEGSYKQDVQKVQNPVFGNSVYLVYSGIEFSTVSDFINLAFNQVNNKIIPLEIMKWSYEMPVLFLDQFQERSIEDSMKKKIESLSTSINDF